MEDYPSVDQWLNEAKQATSAPRCGMYLVHNGTVRQDAKKKVREGAGDTLPVSEMEFSYDEDKVNAAVAQAYQLEGIYYIKVWLNSGRLKVGDDIMLVLIGGDIRPHVVDALNFLVGKIKDECVAEKEIY